MRGIKSYIVFLLVAIIIVAILFFPISNVLEGFVDNHIKTEASKSRRLLIEKKDSLMLSLIKNRISGRFSCILFHNNEPQYKPVSPKQRDFLKEYVTKGMNFDNNLYIFNPTFVNEEKYSLNLLCYTITDWNALKGHDKYVPLENKDLNGWFQSGWALGCASGIGDQYECFLVHPYIIDFGNDDSNILNLKEVLNYSFDFFTRNENSDFYNCTDTINFKSFKRLNSPAFKGNDYWYWNTEGALDRYVTDEFHAWQIYGQSWFFKDYRVYLGISNRTIYKLEYDDDYASKKREKLITFYNLILLAIICFIELVIILIFIYRIRAYKKKHTSYLQRVISSSNPKRYMKNGIYDKEKVGIANTIYDIALKTSENDKEAIVLLSKEIEDKLGLFLITHGEIEELRGRSHPKHFMKPYDAQKVKTANELYAKLNTDKLSYTEYLTYIKQVSELYNNTNDKGQML